MREHPHRKNGATAVFPATGDAEEIQRCLGPFLRRFDAHLIVFGSRARGETHRASDLDLALLADRPIPTWALAEMRECLENSNLPFRIDLVDYARAPAELKRAIDEEGVPWPL